MRYSALAIAILAAAGGGLLFLSRNGGQGGVAIGFRAAGRRLRQGLSVAGLADGPDKRINVAPETRKKRLTGEPMAGYGA